MAMAAMRIMAGSLCVVDLTSMKDLFPIRCPVHVGEAKTPVSFSYVQHTVSLPTMPYLYLLIYHYEALRKFIFYGLESRDEDNYSEHKNNYCISNWDKIWADRIINIPGGLEACKLKCDASLTCKAVTFGIFGRVPNNCALCDSVRLKYGNWGPSNGPDTYVKPNKGIVLEAFKLAMICFIIK